MPTPNHALIVVDVQNDFCPGGSLAVSQGDTIIPGINELAKQVDLVVFTQDWHPANHSSFKEFGGPWPAHCVADTTGAQFHPDLIIPPNALFIKKGTNPAAESYSAVADVAGQATELIKTLTHHNVGSVTVVGLATDYCVKATASDLAKFGLHVTVHLDLCKGVAPESVLDAVAEMRQLGITVVE